MNEPSARRSDAPQSDIQAVSRASRILALFRPGRPRLTVAGAAAEPGPNRTTTHRYFASLVSAGMLGRSRDEASSAPGSLPVQLGAFAIGRRHIAKSDITAVGAPIFDEAGIRATIAIIGTARTLPVHEPGAAWRDLASTTYELGKGLGGEHHLPQGFASLL